MPQTLVGTVIVQNAAAVCQRPDGTIFPGTFAAAFGGLRRYDAGKRIYRSDGVFQMENDAQVAARLGR